MFGTQGGRQQHFLAYCFSLLLAYPTAASGQEKKILVVVGVTNQVKDERWQDRRIGFGLSSLIAEAFFDSGLFVLVEEKEDIRDRLAAVREKLWMLSEEGLQLREATETAALAGAEMLAYGRVVSFKTPTTRTSIGPLHSREKSTEIKVKVFLRDLQTDTTYSAEGTGKAKTKATSVVFEYREDRDEINFDKTAVGQATKQAVAAAVARVLKAYRRQ